MADTLNSLPPLRHALEALLLRRDLAEAEAEGAVGEIMGGEADEILIGAFLTALRVKGETVEELVGAARAMRARATPLTVHRSGLLDTCGTGGDKLRTFNISTATAIVAAAAGVPVAKHGNRSVSSSSGSAEALEALGVRINLTAEQVARCLDEIGIGFCFAPLFHGAMKHAGPVRKRLGFRTIFNLLGPLTNPARAEFQLLGANSLPHAEKLANALQRLGCRRGLVVCGAGELDEVALWGETTVFEVEGESIRRHVWRAETFGLEEVRVGELVVNSPAESAARIHAVFAGTESGGGPATRMVLANSAAALLAASAVATLQEGVAKARQVLESGAAGEKLRELSAWTQGAE